jgi:cytochrome c-type biogenesis protein CcmE
MSDLSPRTGPDTVTAPRRRRAWLPLLVLGVVLVAGGVIVTQFLRSAVDYYCNVDEIDARSGCDGDRRLRLQGVVEQGTIVEEGGDTSFMIGFNGATVPVHYDGEPGGIFKECISVVVHGRFDGSEVSAAGAEVFQGDRVEVKHSDEYVAVNDERLDESDALSEACEDGVGA